MKLIARFFEYLYNAADQLISQTANGATVKYEYDHMGNCISETGSSVTVTMEYSVLGELTGWSDGTLTQENLYDYNGQRIKRTEGSDTDYYFYENGVVSVIEGGSSVTAANVLTNEGGIVGSFRGNIYHNYLTDVQGSTTNIIKEDGTLSAAYDYTDFGETTELTGNGFDNQICYTGGIYDESTALYYLNARYYDPETGRFISQDSYRGELNNPGQWHLYAYCANNPINYVDPSGHYVAVIRLAAGIYRVKKAGKVVSVGSQVSYKNDTLTVIAVIGLTLYSGLSFIKVKAKKKVTIKSGKEKSSDAPDWAKAKKYDPKKSAKENAERVMNEKYGKGNWRKTTNSEYSRIVKWLTRSKGYK